MLTSRKINYFARVGASVLGTSHRGSAHMPARKHNSGFTLVELLVAMAVGLLVVLAAVAALMTSRRGANTVDVASQLRDSGRFATEVVQRLVVQTGFEDIEYSAKAYSTSLSDYANNNLKDRDGSDGIELAEFQAPLLGCNNASFSGNNGLLGSCVDHAAGADTGNSDVLIMQYQPVKLDITADDDSASGFRPDGSMIDCTGFDAEFMSASRHERMVSVLYVGQGEDGEPALMCRAGVSETGDFFNARGNATPLVRGVESFQVLYGVDNVEPNTEPSGSVTTVPNRYLRADQLTVAGDANATYTNWRRVRSVRIGMVLRGAEGSAQETNTQDFYPLGSARYSGAGDPGTVLRPNDRRLRQVVNFTVLLRNCQNSGYQTQPNDIDDAVACDVRLPS